VTMDYKATEFNSQESYDIAVLKLPKDITRVEINWSNWHIAIDDASGFKRRAFHQRKSGIINDICEWMHSKTAGGFPIKILSLDNAKENLAAVKEEKGENWKLAFKVKLTAQKTPQQNSQAKTAFTVLSGQA
jgi:hypothetical protein